MTMNPMRESHCFNAAAILVLMGLSACKTTQAIEAALPKLPTVAQWQKLNTEPFPGKQDDIFFIDSMTGWYGNGKGKIFKTVDGGDTWTQKLNQPGTFFRTIIFVDAQHGFAGNIGPDYFPGVTDETPLYETTDGGETWAKATQIEGPAVKGLCAFQALKEKVINSGVLVERQLIYGAGRVGGPTFLIRSLDGGKTFKSQSLDAVAAMVLDVHFFNAREGLIFAASDADVEKSHGRILRTEDGGQSWKVVYESTRGFELMWKAHFPTAQTGYATLQTYDPKAPQNFVLKTVDGGRSWVEMVLTQEAGVRQFGVGFVNENEGYVGTTTGGYETRDGGKTWQRVNFGKGVNRVRVLQEGSKVSLFAIGLDVYRLVFDTLRPVQAPTVMQ
jgi:photosystem II stability/assembly factor-like uncharacterized protein